MEQKTSKINDSTDVWRTVLEYVLSRIRQRYNTVDEAKADVNKTFKEVMVVIQDNYDRFFERELFSNLDAYGIEILGDDVVIEEPNEEFIDEFETEKERTNNDAIKENFFEEQPK